MSAVTTTRTTRDLRGWVYRGVAGLVALFLMAISASWLLWPFGWIVMSDVADPERARWAAAVWGAFMTLLMALPLAATIRRPRETVGLLQYFIIGYGAIAVASIWIFDALEVSQFVPLVLLAAAHPTPRALLSFPGPADRRVLGATALAAVGLVSVVSDAFRTAAADAGSELELIGVWWQPVFISGLVVLGGILAGLRVAGSRTLVRLIGVAFVYLGVASVILPTHVGSWGVGPGLAAVAAGGAAILAPRFMATSDART